MFNNVKSAVLGLMAPATPIDHTNENAAHKLIVKTEKVIKNKMAGVMQPVDQKVMIIGNNQSSKVKKFMGLEYEQVHDGKGPDLDQLKFTFISHKLQSTLKLGLLAELLPKSSAYCKDKPLVIFIHGFTDDPTLFNFAAIQDAFETKGHHNILALDASPLIRFLYLRATTYVRFIGEKLGATLATMVESGLDHKNIHLVGHSLGSHIAGFAGKSFHSLTGKLISRISGLDPAGPCFSHVDRNLRLAPTDAEFVDVIHTNAGVYGLRSPVGHVDFFPNGGEQQPNCLFQFESHNRVVELFAESVRNPEAFPARPCKDWKEFQKEESLTDEVFMGYSCNPKAKGLYFLRTGDEPCYGLGKDGLLFQNEGIIKTAKQIRHRLANILD